MRETCMVRLLDRCAIIRVALIVFVSSFLRVSRTPSKFFNTYNRCIHSLLDVYTVVFVC